MYRNETNCNIRHGSITGLILLFLFSGSLSAYQPPATINSPDLRTQIGQMLMVGFQGFSVADTSHIIRDIEENHIGGVILFDYDVPTRQPNRNIKNPEQVIRLVNDLQGLSETPLFIAIDQEGGRVARLKPERGFTAHRSAKYLGSLDNPDSTAYFASQKASQLQSLGINVNFAPVVDLDINPENPVIGQLERSFSADPERVTKHAAIFLEAFNEHGVLGVLKHFPGHGSAWNDSHVGMADVTDTWEETELIPYQNLTHSGIPFAIMTAHVFNENLDSEVPATLSYPVQTEMLRNQIGFEGILFSDDMQMDAIRSFYGLESAIKKSINAGVDVLVFANNSVYDPDIAKKAVDIIVEMVENGEIAEETINNSYKRIIAAKKKMFEGLD